MNQKINSNDAPEMYPVVMCILSFGKYEMKKKLLFSFCEITHRIQRLLTNTFRGITVYLGISIQQKKPYDCQVGGHKPIYSYNWLWLAESRSKPL